MVDDDVRNGLAATCFCVVFITSVVLFSVSFDTIDPTEAGVRYNAVSKSIDENKVYNNGRYFVGLGSEFKKYPMTLVHVLYDRRNRLTCWTLEGQEVEVDVSWWYRLQRDHVIDLYHRYTDDFGSRLVQIGVKMVKEVCSNFTAEDFFLRRQEIGESMLIAMRDRFELEWATIEIFNLRAIGIPDRFEQKVIDKVVTAQHQKTAVNLREIALRQSEINVVLGDGQAAINQTRFQSDAAGDLIIARAHARGLLLLRQQEAQSYSELQDVLGLDSIGLLQYRWAQTVDKLEHNRDTMTSKNRGLSFLVGFSSPVIKVATT